MHRSKLPTLICVTFLFTGVLACDPPKTRLEQKTEIAQGTRMARFRLELWQDVQLQTLDTQGGTEHLNVLKKYSTEPTAFEFWMGGGPDIKTLCLQPTFGGRTAFLRFANLVLHAHSADATSWGFDFDTEMETASGTTMSGWPYTQHSPLSIDVGKPLEFRLSGFSDVTREPEAVYTPVARLTLLEVANTYGDKVKHAGKLKIPDELKRQIETDRTSFAKNPHATTTQSAK